MDINVLAYLLESARRNAEDHWFDGRTKKGHASGGYNICNAQLSGDPLGGWN